MRGNPAAEYAALMQSRTADGTSGGVQGHVQFAGMQQVGMNQAMGERGFGAGMMDGGYAPRGDPAAACAAMMQAQTAPAQIPTTQMQLGAPAAGTGWQGATMDQLNMNRGITSSKYITREVIILLIGMYRWAEGHQQTVHNACL